MVDESLIEGMKEKKNEYLEEYEEIKKRLEEIKDEEKRLKDELKRVRDHLSYYRSLVADMKKNMKGRKGLDIFDHL